MRTSNRLTPLKIANLSKPGRYSDGNGLYLQVSRGGTKSWVLRYMLGGRARTMGLGSIKVFTLKEARERARLLQQKLFDGIDPIEAKALERQQQRLEASRSIKFRDAATSYISAHKAGWRNAKHADQWRNTLDRYVFPTMGDLSVADIGVDHVMRVLEPIWSSKTETASRVRGRIEAILDWAAVRNYRSVENPARWKGHLDKLLPARNKVTKVKHLAAMPYAEVPAFLAELRGCEFVTAKALELTILTGVRTSEALKARWVEFDLDARVWNVPAERMKAGRDHRVPLSDRAVEIVRSLPRENDGDGYVFVGARRGRPLSNMAMLMHLRSARGAGLTVHGFRSSFRDWAAEQTNFPREIAEAALGHVVGDQTERAYQRGDLLEKRRRLMQAWDRYCSSAPANSSVVPLARATA